MTEEERRQPHPQEPAEGSEEDINVPGADRPGDPANPGTASGPGQDADERAAEHPREPAEGGEDEETPGADKPSNAG